MPYSEDFKKVLLADPDAILGKKGLTDDFINHILKLLKRHKIIKIKALRSIATRANINKLAIEISKLTASHLLDIRGKSIILTKYSIEKFN